MKASGANVYKINKDLSEKKLEESLLIKDMQKLKDELEKKEFFFKAKTGKQDMMFGSISSKQIKEILTENNIYFEREKIFKELGRLRFDFFLPEYDTLIEYDGIQHFKPIEFFGGESQLEYVQSNDSKKNQFCTDNNIRLVRIRYDEPIDSKVLEIFNKTK